MFIIILLWCLTVFEKLPQDSNNKEMLKVAIWVPGTTLNLMFEYRVWTIVQPGVVLLWLVWEMTRITSLVTSLFLLLYMVIRRCGQVNKWIGLPFSSHCKALESHSPRPCLLYHPRQTKLERDKVRLVVPAIPPTNHPHAMPSRVIVQNVPLCKHQVQCGSQDPYRDLQQLFVIQVLRQLLKHTWAPEEDHEEHKDEDGKSDGQDVLALSFNLTDRVECEEANHSWIRSWVLSPRKPNSRMGQLGLISHLLLLVRIVFD